MTNAAQDLEAGERDRPVSLCVGFSNGASHIEPALAGIESLDDVDRQGAEIIKRHENRTSVYRGQCGLIEHYLKVQACLGLRCIRGEFEQRGFVFQRLRPGEEDSRLRALSDQYKSVRFGRDGQQPFMLTDNVETVQTPKQTVTSVVRPERFENTYISRGKPLFTFYPALGINEVVVAPKKREVRILPGTLAIASSDRGAEQIESTPEGVNDGANPRVDRDWQMALFTEYRDFLEGLRIYIPDLYAGILLLPIVKLSGEEWELGFAPVD